VTSAAEYLSRPGLARLLAAARDRYEANGGPRGRVVLEELAPEEASALNGLLAQQPSFAPGGAARIALPRLDAELRASRLGVSLAEALGLVGPPPRDGPADRARAQANREAAWAEVLAHPAASRPELAPWLEHARRMWGAARPGPHRTAVRALDVLAALPARGEELAALAARHCGDAHALDRSRPLGRMVVAGLLALEGRPPGTALGAADWRGLWERAGVVCDALSCTVLAVGLQPARRLRGGYLARRLRAAARAGEPVVLTLRELRAHPFALRGTALYVVENPAVVAAAAQALGPTPPPLLCTGGWPNTAVATVLDAAASARIELRVHADFDWAGAAIVARLAADRDARPWRYSRSDYEAALADGAGGAPLPAPPSETTPDGDDVTAALDLHRRAVHEEAVLDDLLCDLRDHARRRDAA
jgi:uncharacterized protein (TIGR02679 family)